MRDLLSVSVLNFTPAVRLDQRQGLLGYVCIEIGGLLELDCVTVRRTNRGDLRLSFPERVDSSGVRHAILRPVHCMDWRAIERRVLLDLERRGLLSLTPTVLE